MKLYHLSFSTLVIRFYLMMAIVILAGFTGIWLVGMLALPVFFACLLGVKFGGRDTNSHTLNQEAESRSRMPLGELSARHAA